MNLSVQLVPGYSLQIGSTLDRSLLLQYMQRTYQELFGDRNFAHLEQTVEQYLSMTTPVWWVIGERAERVGCLWLGTSIDQVTGDRHTYIFMLYVQPEHRRRGIGTALMRQAETWAKQRGDRQIGLQVFHQNQPALHLYEKLGYQAQSIWMMKPL